MVSHEVWTPLTMVEDSTATVLGASTTLSSTEMGNLFRITDEQADHIRILINDLLDVTHTETGTLPITPGPTVVADVVGPARSVFLHVGGGNSFEDSPSTFGR